MHLAPWTVQSEKDKCVLFQITASPKYVRVCRTQPGTALAHRSPGLGLCRCEGQGIKSDLLHGESSALSRRAA